MRHILTREAESLDRLRCGRGVQRKLAALEVELSAIEPFKKRAPGTLRPHLAAMDRLMRNLRSLFSVFGELPDCSPEQAVAAERLVAALTRVNREKSALDRVTTWSELNSRRAHLAPDLALFPETPIPRLVDAWFAAGRDLDQALTRTCERPLNPPRRPQAVLAETRNVLNTLRQLIRAELLFYPDLPRNLEKRVFAMADRLSTN